nr:NEW3 domain-containing protein [Nocardioides currus]
MERGTTATSTLTVANQLGPVVKPASLAFDAPAGWTVSAPRPGKLQPHRSVDLPLTVTVPAGATGGTYRVPVRLTDDAGRSSAGTVTVVVPKTADEVDGRISVTGGTLTNAHPAPYALGDRLQFSYRVTNLTDAVTTVVATGNLRDLDPAVDARNCRWRNLPGAGAYSCTSAYHLVTQADLDRGSFTPLTTWTSTSGDDVTTVEHAGPAVSLR